MGIYSHFKKKIVKKIRHKNMGMEIESTVLRVGLDGRKVEESRVEFVKNRKILD